MALRCGWTLLVLFICFLVKTSGFACSNYKGCPALTLCSCQEKSRGCPIVECDIDAVKLANAMAEIDRPVYQLTLTYAENVPSQRRFPTRFLDGKEIKFLNLNPNQAFREIQENTLQGVKGVIKLAIQEATGLTSIHSRAFSSLTDLEELKITKATSLNHVKLNLTGLKSLSRVGLTNSNISRIDQFTDKTEDIELRLTGNPLNCDCNLQWLRDATWSKHSNLGQCAAPPSLKGTKLMAVMSKDLVCGGSCSLQGTVVIVACLWLAQLLCKYMW